MSEEDCYLRRRLAMVESQLSARGVHDDRLLQVMRKVPRHLFVPEELHNRAYEDSPLPLGPEQSISQPLVVAEMLELLKLKPTDRVLEIGTGSGYETALLSHLCEQVFTIEIDSALYEWSALVFKRLGITNIQQKLGDGYLGWPEAAPFDAVILSAATPYMPELLLTQLQEGGRCVFPFGREHQDLVLFQKSGDRVVRSEHGSVRFVMMKES